MVVYPRPFFLDVVLLFLRPYPSVCEKPQAVVGHRVAQHTKFDFNGGDVCWAENA
jgi:hypothetical protein